MSPVPEKKQSTSGTSMRKARGFPVVVREEPTTERVRMGMGPEEPGSEDRASVDVSEGAWPSASRSEVTTTCGTPKSACSVWKAASRSEKEAIGVPVRTLGVGQGCCMRGEPTHSLELELVGQDQVRVTDEDLVCARHVCGHVQLALVAHDRVKDCAERQPRSYLILQATRLLGHGSHAERLPQKNEPGLLLACAFKSRPMAPTALTASAPGA